MTAAQLHDARMLIPGACEPNVPLHRATPSVRLVPAPVEEVRGHSAIASYIVAAPASPTTRLGYAASILGDLALVAGIIYGVAVVPALAMHGIRAAATLIQNTFGGP